MNLRLTTTIWITLALATTSCKKDPLIVPYNPLATIVKEGRIKHIAVSDKQIVFSNSEPELIVIDRRTNSKKHYHKFNSHVQEIFKIQNSGNGKILIGDNKSGLYYYQNDTAKFIVTGHEFRDFDYQRQTCWRGAWEFQLIDQLDSPKVWSTQEFRGSAGSGKTQMMAFNNTVWIGLRVGLCRMEVNNPVFKWVKQDYSLAYETVQLKLDSLDQIWWLTKNYLSIYKGGKWEEHNLPDNITPSDLVVLSNMAFISSDNGVYRFENNQFEPISEINENLPHQYVTCLTIEGDHTLWLGTGKGIYTFPVSQ